MRIFARMLLLAPLLFAAAPARADEAADKRKQAMNYFDAGAHAYEAGQYQVAAEAFLSAHEILPSPALLFSAAQAYRRLYLSEPSPDTLRHAIKLYRDYLRMDPKPKRREDAMEALGALVPLEQRLPPAASALVGEGEAPVMSKLVPIRATRLLLTSAAESAEASVDGGPFSPAPAVIRVQPGSHQVRVRAPGYEEEEIRVEAVEHELLPRNVELRPKPAKLRVVGTSGARVLVDGQLRATLPLLSPISLEPGTHFVAVTRSGYEPYSQVIELGRDGSNEIHAALSPTTQRIAAWTVLSAGAAGAIVGGTLTGLMLSRQSEANDLLTQQQSTPLTPEERDRYNLAVGARNDLALAAGITSGVAALCLVTGGGLMLFDEPEVVTPGREQKRAPAPPTKPRAEFTVGLLSVGARLDF